MHALRSAVFNQLLVAEVWVHFHLVYSWYNLGIGQHILQLLDTQVADTNVFGQTLQQIAFAKTGMEAASAANVQGTWTELFTFSTSFSIACQVSLKVGVSSLVCLRSPRLWPSSSFS